MICKFLFNGSSFRTVKMSTNEGTVQQPVETTESKKDKGVSKATAQKLLAKYKLLQVRYLSNSNG